MSYTVEQRGVKHTETFSVYFKDGEGKYISPFHDIPTFADEENGIVNMVCEVPRWSNAKMEITKDHPLNPIRQDTKKGKMRFVHNCFPHKGYIWNYGAIPQTWENPDETDTHTGEKGDNDPLDICELGSRVAQIGEVIQVKILGVLAMIDDGETDWKVLGIDIRDPMAEKLNDVEDIEKVMKGYLAATVEWFRIYKIPAGKPENKFAFNSEPRGREFAMSIIEETRTQWQRLSSGEVSHAKVVTMATTAGASVVSAEEAAAVVAATPAAGPDAEIPQEVDEWHYVTI
jgi:inorganic pyrophosphatase